MVGIKSLARRSLETNPRTPASLRCPISARTSCMLLLTTMVCGQYARISRAAWIPFLRGISISKIAKSGHSLLAFSTASIPSAASPHISQSGLSASRILIAVLATWLSSTIRILAGNGGPRFCRIRQDKLEAISNTSGFRVGKSSCVALRRTVAQFGSPEALDPYHL
jgi:hypothetical protein